MDFSVEKLYNSEKEMQTILKQIVKATKTCSTREINHSILMKLNKDVLSTYVKNLVDVVENNLELCKLAANKVDQLKTEQIVNQKELIKAHQEQLTSVQETVKTEIKSWADVARTNTNQSMAVSVKTVKEAVKTAVAEDDRAKRFMIYGLQEAEEGKEDDLVDAVEATFEKTGIVPYPPIHSVYRMGAKTPGKARPVKIQLSCAIHVQRVLSAASKLRSYEGEFRTVYLAPDRTREQQLAHGKLVKEMKELISNNPSKYYFIRNNKINCIDKVLSTDN